jgi:N-acetylglucosamine-6-phosphate deacetylase
LREDGCSRFFFTLITAEWNRLIHRFRHAKSLRDQVPELRRAIAGWHIEGPFLSTEPGYHGAHDPSVMCDPSPGLVRELRGIAGSDPLLLTLAPERPGAIEAISLAVSLGMQVSLGHTGAPAELLHRAVNAGARGFTHLGNGCPSELNRHDNVLWRVFETPGLTVSLIPDGIHVSPPLFRLVHKALGPGAIYYTTDAMSAAGAPPGRYPLGGLTLEVGADRVVRQPGKSNFAGSALSPIEGVFCAAQMLGRDWQSVWDFSSVRPAEWMKLEAGLVAGRPGHFCLLDFSQNQRLPRVECIGNDT